MYMAVIFAVLPKVPKAVSRKEDHNVLMSEA